MKIISWIKSILALMVVLLACIIIWIGAAIFHLLMGIGAFILIGGTSWIILRSISDEKSLLKSDRSKDQSLQQE